MQMNSSLILQGQPVNVLAAIMDAQEAAKGQYGFNRQRGYDNMLAANGPGIVAGETGAMNALAGYDPQAALGAQATQLGMQDTRLGMDATRQRMDILDAQERRAVETYAAGLDAAQAAAEAAQTEEAIKMGMMIPDAATWDAQMAQIAPDLVGQFANREALAARFMSMAEILKERAGADAGDVTTGAPAGTMWVDPANPAAGVKPIPGYTPGPADDYERYRQREIAAGRTPLDDIAYAQSIKGNGASVTLPDGTVMQMGGQAKPFTEAQSKDNVYATRAEGALAALEAPSDPNNPQSSPMGSALTSYGQQLTEMVPFGLARGLQTDQFQLGQNAGRDFLVAILRKDTGAAVTPSEEKIYGEIFLPQPGDGKALLEQKRIARARAVEALKAGMSSGQIEAMGRALVATAQRVGAPSPAGPVVVDGFTIEAVE